MISKLLLLLLMSMNYLIILSFILLVNINLALAKDYKTPHILKPGDAISSDVFNEIFQKIENLNKPINLSELVGNWACEKVAILNTQSTPSYYTAVGKSSIVSAKMGLKFVLNEDGTYSWSSTPLNGLLTPGDDQCDGAGIISIYKVISVMTVSACNNDFRNAGIRAYITKYSDTQIEISQNHSGGQFPTIFCDKNDLAPNIPTDLVSSSDGSKIILSWTDNSSDETGFKILRKDKLEGSFNEIGSVNADINSFQDTLPSSGTYWYRIIAINDNGESLGSQVLKIEKEGE